MDEWKLLENEGFHSGERAQAKCGKLWAMAKRRGKMGGARPGAGRPSKYDKLLAQRIARKVANGQTLTALCREADMPHRSTVVRWMIRHTEFAALMARARETQVAVLVDEMIDIADDNRDDTYEDEMGRRLPNAESVPRSRLRVGTRQWLAARLQPDQYGDAMRIRSELTFADLANKAEEE